MRLEQGRNTHPSSGVLDAVARALQLNHDERRHLYDLAYPDRTVDESGRPGDGGTDEVMQRVLSGLAHAPALVLTPALEVVAANDAALALFGSLVTVGGNLLRAAFADDPLLARTPSWEAVAAEAVASLHVQAARYPADDGISALVEELSVSSAEFTRLWARHDARERGTTSVSVVHPDVGEVRLTNIWLSPPSSPHHTLVVYTVEPGSPSADRLDRLLGRGEPSHEERS